MTEAAGEEVIAAAADERVVPVPADERVVAVEAADGVSAAGTDEEVVRARSPQRAPGRRCAERLPCRVVVRISGRQLPSTAAVRVHHPDLQVAVERYLGPVGRPRRVVGIDGERGEAADKCSVGVHGEDRLGAVARAREQDRLPIRRPCGARLVPSRRQLLLLAGCDADGVHVLAVTRVATVRRERDRRPVRRPRRPRRIPARIGRELTAISSARVHEKHIRAVGERDRRTVRRPRRVGISAVDREHPECIAVRLEQLDPVPPGPVRHDGELRTVGRPGGLRVPDLELDAPLAASVGVHRRDPAGGGERDTTIGHRGRCCAARVGTCERNQGDQRRRHDPEHDAPLVGRAESTPGFLRRRELSVRTFRSEVNPPCVGVRSRCRPHRVRPDRRR